MILNDKLQKIINTYQNNIKIINHTEFTSGQYKKNNYRIILLFFCELCNKQLYQIKYDNGQVSIESWKNWKMLNNPEFEIYPKDAYIYRPTGEQWDDSLFSTVSELLKQNIPDN